MLKKNFLDQDGLNHRLEMLRQLAESINREIDEIVRIAGEKTSPKNENGLEPSLDEQVRKFEIDLIRFALFKTGGKQISAAKFLNIKPTTLNSRIKRYRISVESYRLKPLNRKGVLKEEQC